MNGDDPKLVMARRAAASVWTKQGVQDFADRIMAGSDDFCEEVQAALAAIIETTAAAAKLAGDTIDEARVGEIDSDLRCVKHIIVSRLADGTHYGKAEQ